MHALLFAQVKLLQSTQPWHPQAAVCVCVCMASPFELLSGRSCELGSSSSQPGYHTWVLTVLPPSPQQKFEQIRLGSGWESSTTQGQQRMKGAKQMKQAVLKSLQKQPFATFREPHNSIRAKLPSLGGKEEKMPCVRIIWGTAQSGEAGRRRRHVTGALCLSPTSSTSQERCGVVAGTPQPLPPCRSSGTLARSRACSGQKDKSLTWLLLRVQIW